jgi:tetratricopeptide (TPR) repeat protein
MLKPGDSLGPYKLIDKIGGGSFANVWRAKKREGFGPEVAIKVLHSNDNPQAFQQEVAIWKELGDYPNVMPFIAADIYNDYYAIKVLHSNDNPQAFQQEVAIWEELVDHPNVMPFIAADIYDDYYAITSHYTPEGSLDSWLKNNNGRAPSEKVAIELTLGILEGVAHLHNKKIIHSDLAPKNILLQRGIPRLIDFGISKIFTSTHSTVKGSSGTPIYKAPEVYNGETSRRSDIWSVGVIFYQLLCGQLPFEGKTYPVLFKKISFDPITPLPTTVAKPIQKIIYRALEKDRKDRFQTAEAMIEALKAASLSNTANPLPPLKDASAYFNRALENYKQGQLDQALADYNKAIELDPKGAYAYYGRGNVYKNQGQLNQALAEYTKALQLDPTFAAAYFNRGLVYSDQGKLDQALPDFNLAIQLDPTFAVAYNNRGIVYYKQGQLDLALADYNLAIEFDPKYAAAYNNRGIVYSDQGKLDQALSDYNQSLTLDPKNAAAYNNRGIVYSDQGKLDQALSDYNQSLTLDPKNVVAYNNRGIVYYKQGKLDLALANYNLAIEFDPKPPAFTYFNRGLLHKQFNNKAAAIADFQKAKSLYKDPQKIAQCIEQLRNLGVEE